MTTETTATPTFPLDAEQIYGAILAVGEAQPEAINPTGKNWHRDGTPCCIMGHVYAHLGIGLEDVLQHVNSKIPNYGDYPPQTVGGLALLGVLTDKARTIANHVQTDADYNHPWATVAENMVKREARPS